MASLAEIYGRYSGVDYGDRGTVHSYIPYYEHVLAPVRAKVRSVLEVGVAQGHGVMMWREYFPKAHITGVDIQDNYVFDKTLSRTSLWLDRRAELLAEPPKMFDVVFEDGSHILREQIATYHHLKGRCRGWYFIEDVADPDGLLKALGDEPAFVGLIDLRSVKHRWDDMIMAFWHGGL